MYNKHITKTTEASSKRISVNCTEPNKTTEKGFDDYFDKIKKENISLLHDVSSDSEDSASITYTPIDNKNKKQENEQCELASTSYKKNVNVSESNSQVTSLIFFIGF